MDEVCGKCKKKSKDLTIKCSGNCSAVFHLKCIDVSAADYQTIQKMNGARWFCEDCLTKLDKVWGCNSDVAVIHNQLLSDMADMKKMLNNIQGLGLKSENTTGNLSYAKVASEVVIIKPKNANQESKKTLETVQKYVNPAALEVGIKEVRTVKDGGVVIKCNTKDEINKIKNVAEKKLGKNYKVNAPDLRNPSIKLLDIDREFSSEELIDTLKKQNLFLDHESVALNVKIFKKMKTKWMAIIECDPESFSKIMKENALFLDWCRCRVFEYVSVFRCFKCGRFGHKADQCTSSGSICLRCAKPVSEHASDKECDCENLKCVNCMEANNVLKTEFNVNHSLFDRNCPVLLKKIDLQKQKIRYTSDSI